ncbi:hypothetical protein MBT84_38620 [Streptomyces sp. MBT84]|nr:hypothetical protein [Streptomyces sp. MBT84]
MRVFADEVDAVAPALSQIGWLSRPEPVHQEVACDGVMPRQGGGSGSAGEAAVSAVGSSSSASRSPCLPPRQAVGLCRGARRSSQRQCRSSGQCSGCRAKQGTGRLPSERSPLSRSAAGRAWAPFPPRRRYRAASCSGRRTSPQVTDQTTADIGVLSVGRFHGHPSTAAPSAAHQGRRRLSARSDTDVPTTAKSHSSESRCGTHGRKNAVAGDSITLLRCVRVLDRKRRWEP